MALTKISSNLVADDAIVTGKIADGGVATADLAANAVTTAKIAQNNVTAHHIADGSITTTQLAADAVTNAKIADDAISEEHLDKTIISDLTEVTAVNGDFLMIGDTSDSNNLKKVPVSSLPGSSALPLAGGTLTGGLTGTNATFTGDVAINASSPDLYFGTTGNHYNWRIAAQENVDAAFTIDVGSQDTAYGDDTYNSVFTVKNTGDVGIGTTNPQGNLHVVGVAGSSGRIYVSDTDDGEGGGDSLLINKSGASAYIYNRDSNHLYLGTNDDSDMVIIDSSGKVSIGGTPQGNLTIKGAASDDIDLLTFSEDGTNQSFSFNGNFAGTGSTGNNLTLDSYWTNDIMAWTGDGKVGIGDDSPSRRLTVKSAGANATQISLVDNDSTNEVFAVGQQSDGDGFLTLKQDDGTTKVLFDASGDSYIAGGSLHIGTTDSIASSSEIFSVYSASTGHTKLVNNSDSYGTVYMHNESTTANTFQPSIIIQKGGGNRANIGVRHSDSVLGIHGQGAISLRTGSTSLQASSERLNIGSDGFAKLAGGCGIGALHNTGQSVANSFVDFFDFSDLAPGSGQERGMYLVSMSRNGGSVGTRILAYIGVSTNSTVYVYEILASAGSMSLQSNGTSLQVKTGSSSNQSIQGTAIPVAIDHN